MQFRASQNVQSKNVFVFYRSLLVSWNTPEVFFETISPTPFGPWKSIFPLEILCKSSTRSYGAQFWVNGTCSGFSKSPKWGCFGVQQVPTSVLQHPRSVFWNHLSISIWTMEMNYFLWKPCVKPQHGHMELNFWWIMQFRASQSLQSEAFFVFYRSLLVSWNTPEVFFETISPIPFGPWKWIISFGYPV